MYSNITPPELLPSATRHRLIRSLDSWNFEPHKLPEEEILSCALILFELLFRIEGMTDQVGVSLGQFLITTLFHFISFFKQIICLPFCDIYVRFTDLRILIITFDMHWTFCRLLTRSCLPRAWSLPHPYSSIQTSECGNQIRRSQPMR